MIAQNVITPFDRPMTVLRFSLMRNLLCALILFSASTLSAHPQDPREKKVSPGRDVYGMTVVTLISTQRDTLKSDTICVENYAYSFGTKFLERYDYRVKLDGGTFSSRTDYQYWQANAWSVREYENGVEVSTGEVRNDTAQIISPRENGRTVVYDYVGDSLQESVVTGSDTVRRARKFYFRAWDPEWDYEHAGTFARRVVTKSADCDSIRYLNADGKCLIMIVHHFNAMFKPVKSEYFNYGIKTFGLIQMRYTSYMNMIFYLKRSKRGKCTYVVLRKYTDTGLLLEEKFVPKTKSVSIVTKKYSYTIAR